MLRVSEDHLCDFAGILGYKIGMLPTSYLGLPVYWYSLKIIVVPGGGKVRGETGFLEGELSLSWRGDYSR